MTYALLLCICIRPAKTRVLFDKVNCQVRDVSKGITSHECCALTVRIIMTDIILAQ